MSERFASKRDTWVVFLGCGATVVCVISLTPLLVGDIDGIIKVIVAGMMILTIGLVSWVTFGTYYLVDADELWIRSGPFRWRIPLRDINKVSSTRAPGSSPALSLDRLRIDYGDGKWILVSPLRRNEFIHRLGMGGD